MSSSRTLQVGLISDTHGLLRLEVVEALRGSDFIVHAGDIGSPEILEELGRIAPVTAVRGNNDNGGWIQHVPLTDDLTVGGVRIHVIHDLAHLGQDDACDARVIVSGHSHRPKVETRGGVLLVNPGSAGRRRFTLPVSVARLHLEGTEVTAELVTLE
jgi:putative phosphoesterase